MTSIPEFDETTIRHLRTSIVDFKKAAASQDNNAAKSRQDARDAAAAAAARRSKAAQYQRLLDFAEGKPPATPEPDPVDERAAVVAGVREFADFLEENPDVPIENTMLHYFPRAGDTADRVAEVNRIAGILGVAAGRQNRSSTHHVAERTFGPITYATTVCDVYDQPANPLDCVHDCDEDNCANEECAMCTCCGVPEAAVADGEARA